MKKPAPKSKKSPALKGLHAAGPVPAMGKARPPVDPTKGLRDALKVVQLQTLAKAVAEESGGL